MKTIYLIVVLLLLASCTGQLSDSSKEDHLAINANLKTVLDNQEILNKNLNQIAENQNTLNENIKVLYDNQEALMNQCRGVNNG